LATLKHLAAPAQCAEHPSPLRVSAAMQRGANTGATLTLRYSLYPTPWRCAEQHSREGKKQPDAWAWRVSGCSLPGEQRKASMRSIGAVQGAFEQQGTHVGKQLLVARASARNPKPNRSKSATGYPATGLSRLATAGIC